MQGIHSAVFAGLLVAGGIYAGVASRDDASVDPAITASVGDNAVFRLAARGVSGDCRFAVSQESGAVSLGSGCGQVAPELASAAIWSSGTDGIFTVRDAQGNTLARFEPGDGIAYVSQDNEAPRFTLESEF